MRRNNRIIKKIKLLTDINAEYLFECPEDEDFNEFIKSKLGEKTIFINKNNDTIFESKIKIEYDDSDILDQIEKF